MASSCDAIPKCETFKSVPLDVLLTDVVLDQLDDKLHFNVLFADSKLRYGVTRRSLYGPAGTEKRMVEEISVRMAKQLMTELKTALKYR